MMAMSYSLALVGHGLAPFHGLDQRQQVEDLLLHVDDLELAALAAGEIENGNSRLAHQMASRTSATSAYLNTGPVLADVQAVDLAVPALARRRTSCGARARRRCSRPSSCPSCRSSMITNLYMIGGPQTTATVRAGSILTFGHQRGDDAHVALPVLVAAVHGLQEGHVRLRRPRRAPRRRTAGPPASCAEQDRHLAVVLAVVAARSGSPSGPAPGRCRRR